VAPTFRTGDEVFIHAEFARGGSCVEYGAVDASQVVLKPRSVPFAAAAALLLDPEPEGLSGVLEPRAKTRLIQAHRAAIDRDTASTCNAEQAGLGVMSGVFSKTETDKICGHA